MKESYNGNIFTLKKLQNGTFCCNGEQSPYWALLSSSCRGLTMEFISIVCPIKKRSERVSFHRAIIRIFINFISMIKSTKCHIQGVIFTKDKTKVIFINDESNLWCANCHYSIQQIFPKQDLLTESTHSLTHSLTH